MSCLFRARQPAAAGSGGMTLRGRRALPPASPYDRPAADRDERRSGSGATWFSGIVAGAGRLMSSVFKYESPSSSYSYSYSTNGDDDEGSSINSHEMDDMDVSSKEPVEAKQIERKLEPVTDCNGTSLAIISEIESKHAIEQLLMQETFSRDEGSKLIQIIESRVVEVGNDGKQKELDWITCNAFASPGTGKYLNLSRKLPEANLYSSGSPHAIYPGPSAFQLLTPELRNSVVTEAKKWLEQKRPSSGSKADFGCRPCSSNTNTVQYDFGGEEGSPIDVAKSYMRLLSPGGSPLLSGTRLEKTPCTRMLLYRDEASATPNYSLPSSKGLKRNLPATGLQDTADEIRKVRLKLAGDESNNCTFKLIDPCKGYSKVEACKISSVAEETIHYNSSDRSEALLTSESQKLPPVEINSTLRDVEEGTRLDDVNASSIQLSCGVENNSLNGEQISWAKEIQSVSDPVQQDRIGQTQDKARQPDGNDQTQHEESDLRISADGPLAGFNTNINVALRDEPKTTSCNNNGPAADISDGTCDLASVETSTVPSRRKSNSSIARPRGGTKMKSVKDVLTEGTEPQPSTSRGRGRKSVPGARRGRGRGKSFTPNI